MSARPRVGPWHTRWHVPLPHVLAVLLFTMLLLGVCGGLGGARPRVERSEPFLAPDTIPAAVLALGERVYSGRAGGALCVTCHGVAARGVSGLGPDLTDARWLHGDGSLAFIRGVVRSGVMKPKEAPMPMPAMGGGSLSAEQLDAVAAWVYSQRAAGR